MRKWQCDHYYVFNDWWSMATKILWIKEFRLKPYFIHRPFCRKKKISLSLMGIGLGTNTYRQSNEEMYPKYPAQCQSWSIRGQNWWRLVVITDLKLRLHLTEKDTLYSVSRLTYFKSNVIPSVAQSNWLWQNFYL